MMARFKTLISPTLVAVFAITAVVAGMAGLSPLEANAQLSLNPLNGTQGNISDTGLGNTDPVTVTAQLINVLLGLLGALSLVLFLYAGYRWMIARGNAEDIQSAKQIMQGAVIGLVIILGSYGIVQWIFFYLGLITDAA